jgi:hypothetical protein
VSARQPMVHNANATAQRTCVERLGTERHRDNASRAISAMALTSRVTLCT